MTHSTHRLLETFLKHEPSSANKAIHGILYQAFGINQFLGSGVDKTKSREIGSATALLRKLSKQFPVRALCTLRTSPDVVVWARSRLDNVELTHVLKAFETYAIYENDKTSSLSDTLVKQLQMRKPHMNGASLSSILLEEGSLD